MDVVGADRPYASSRPISIVDLDLDPPGPHEVLVALEAAGVCHSDLSVVNGSRPRPVPMLLGHEGAGRVVEVGSEVTDLEPGQRVIATFLPRCGECGPCGTDGRAPCERGSRANGVGTLLDGGIRLSHDGSTILHHLGVSAFADHAVMDRRSLVPIADDVPPGVAALLGCAALTGGGAVLNAARVEPGETVVVVGLGGVGLSAVLTALALSDVDVVGVDPLAAKQRRAVELGARAMAPDEAVASGLKAPVVIEAAGSARAFETAIALTGIGGRTVTVGLPDPSDLAAVSPLALVAEARTIIGSYLGSAVPTRDIPRLADLWRQGRLPLEELVSSEIALEGINEAMDSLNDGLSLRQVIRFDG